MTKSDGKMEDNHIFTINKYDDETFYEDSVENKNTNYLEFDGDLFKKTYLKNMFSENAIQENINNEDVNSIFNDIDEDYANNETLNM